MQPLHASRHSLTTKIFHWSIATLVVIDFCFALSFSRFNPGDRLYFPAAYAMHMSFGMFVMILSVPFIVRRLARGRKRRIGNPTQDMVKPARALAQIVHAMLYAFMIIVPLTGWAILSVRKKPAVLVDSAHWPNMGFLSSLPHPRRAQLHDLLLPAHIYLGYIGMGLVCLHLLAALYHHFYRHDDVLRGMLPMTKGDTGRTNLENTA